MRPAFPFLFAAAVTCAPLLSAFSQNDSKVNIRIDADVNGKTVKIDTTLNSMEDFDLDQFLDDLGLDDHGNLNINIDDDGVYSYDFEGDSSVWRLYNKLGTLELPEIPELPAGIESFSFNMNDAVLGVMTKTVDDGAEITSVVEKSAAESAGLQNGDIIKKIDDRTVESTSNLTEIIGKYKPDDKVTVTYLREGKEKSVSATLQKNESSFSNMDFNWGDKDLKKEERGFLGVDLDDNGDGKGIVITNVEEKSAAEEAGLKENDVIEQIDGKDMGSYDDVVKAITSKKPGEQVSIKIKRQGVEMNMKATLKSREMYYFDGENGDGSFIPAPPATPAAPGTPATPPAPKGSGSSCLDLKPSCVYAYSYSCPELKTAMVKGGPQNDVRISINIRKVDDTPAPTTEKEAPTGSLLSPEDVQFYPNPTEGTFRLKFHLASAGDTQITVTDFSGKEVYQKQLKNFSGNFEQDIDLSDSPKGNYLIKVSQNGNSVSKTIVLQ